MNAPPGQGNFSFERKVGFIEITAMRHRRGELNIVNDVIGPGEGLLDSGGIDIPPKPAGKGGVAQLPADSPAQATT